MLNIVGKRYWYFGFSLLIIIPGLISLILFGLRLSIDFTGGSLWQLKFTQPTAAIQPADVKGIFSAAGFDEAVVQTSKSSTTDDTIIVRAKQIDATQKADLQSRLQARYGDFEEQRFDNVGPAVGAEVTRNAGIAVGLAAIAILIYISIAFRKVPNSFRYGACAVIALVHDALVVLGLMSLAGHFLGWEVDSLFLTALLTVIGFSVHDTIVVFDRIRENISRYRSQDFETIVNRSIIETLDRSINTQLTVLFTLTALALLGGVTVRIFVVTLLIGILSGTYSSIFNASPLLVVWENGEIGNFVRRFTGNRSAKPA